MPELSTFLRNLLIVFVFFAIGRLLVLRMGGNGAWIIVGGVFVFYVVWWVNYRRNKKK